MRGEFELIETYFAPLARGKAGTFDLHNDAAALQPSAGMDIVLTVDAEVAGVHFLTDDPAAGIARKALRVNLSDLAAMGARPRGYLLALSLPGDIDDDWVADFADGLRADQDNFDIALLGGDTTGTTGPLVISVTAIGEVETGKALPRSGARPGDAVFVSGTIGDAYFGLEALRDGLENLDENHSHHLANRYRLPEPRIALGRALVAEGLATAAIEVSDGLAADLGHIARASGVAATVEAAAVPLSAAARAVIGDAEPKLIEALTGGDDYELLFTVPQEQVSDIAGLAADLDLNLAEIGAISVGEGVEMRDRDGRPLALDHVGWTHF